MNEEDRSDEQPVQEEQAREEQPERSAELQEALDALSEPLADPAEISKSLDTVKQIAEDAARSTDEIRQAVAEMDDCRVYLEAIPREQRGKGSLGLLTRISADLTKLRQRLEHDALTAHARQEALPKGPTIPDQIAELRSEVAVLRLRVEVLEQKAG